MTPAAMLRRSLRRASRHPTPLFPLRNPQTRRYASEASSQTSQSRIDRFNRHVPRFLHKYTNALGTAPLTHISAFLLLHELTAIVPLFGLAGYFHYTHWLPSWFAEGTWVLYGVEKFGGYFRRKGWVRSEEAAEAQADVKLKMRRRDRAFNTSEGGVRLVIEFATAWAVVKMLLPLRIVLSVWGTPWFAAKTVVPVSSRLKRWIGRDTKGRAAPAAGTGAVDAGAVSKTGGPKGQ